MRKFLFILFLFCCKITFAQDTILTNETNGFFLSTSTSFDTLLVASSASWSPIDIAGCKLWMNGDSVSKDVSNYVDTLFDMSGNNNDAIQNTGANQPLWIADGGAGVNNKPVVRFDGSDDFLSNTSILTMFPDGDATLFVVYSINGTVAMYGVISTMTSGGGYWSFGGVGYFRTFSYVRLDGYPATMPTSGVHNFNLRIEGGVSYEIRLDGVSKGNGGSPAFFINEFAVGRGESAIPYNGDIAEVIIYDSALGTTDIQTVENYLMTKYNLSIEWYMIGSLMIGLCFRRKEFFNQFKKAA